MSKEIVDIQIAVVPDLDPDPSYLYQHGFEERAAAYEDGKFSFVGVVAQAKIRINHVEQEISSAGLWGVESDSGQAYFREVGEEEFDLLVDMLKELGFRKSDIGPYSEIDLVETV